MSWIWSGKGMNKTRPKQLSFRVNEEEYQKLQERVQESGKTQQEYILSCVLDKKIVNTDGIKELIPELKRIGNNLNQIAKRCNEGGVLPSEAEVREQGEELKQVWQLLRRYLQRQA
jgi:predicted DNA-binding protein